MGPKPIKKYTFQLVTKVLCNHLMTRILTVTAQSRKLANHSKMLSQAAVHKTKWTFTQLRFNIGGLVFVGRILL